MSGVLSMLILVLMITNMDALDEAYQINVGVYTLGGTHHSFTIDNYFGDASIASLKYAILSQMGIPYYL